MIYAKIKTKVYTFLNRENFSFNYEGNDKFVEIKMAVLNKNLIILKQYKLFNPFYSSSTNVWFSKKNRIIVIPYYEFYNNGIKIFSIENFQEILSLETKYESEKKSVELSIVKMLENQYILTLISLNNDGYIYLYLYILIDREFVGHINIGVKSPSSMNKVLNISNFIHNNIYFLNQRPRNNLYLSIFDKNLNFVKHVELLSHEYDYFSNFSVKLGNNNLVLVFTRLNRYLNDEVSGSIEFLLIDIGEIL